MFDEVEQEQSYPNSTVNRLGKGIDKTEKDDQMSLCSLSTIK